MANAGASTYGLTEEQWQYVQNIAALKRDAAPSSRYGTKAQGGQAIAYKDILAQEIEKIKSGSGGGGQTGGSASGSQATSFSGIQDQDVRNTLKDLINQFNTGGTAEYKKASAERDATLGFLDKSLQDYSKQGAFQDAGDLMAQSLRLSQEKNMPAIQRATEGAGTSAGSMQALLSNKFSLEASQAAGALGATQASEYGRIAASMLNTRAGLTTGVDRTIDPMVKLADALKISQTNQSSYGNFDPASMLNAEANMLRAQNTGQPAAVHSTYGGAPLQNMGSVVPSPMSGSTDWAANEAFWAADKKKEDAKRAAYQADLDARNAAYFNAAQGSTSNASGGFGANWYDQSQMG